MTERPGLERTRAFEIARREFTLPDLTVVDLVTIVTDPVETDIAATYFDTADLRLAARQISLRRTASAEGAGWDLQMEAEDGSTTQVRREAEGEPGVPDELLELVRGSVRDKELGPVAIVRTVRRERQLLDAAGRELARLAEDEVHGQRLTTGAAELSHWRQVEVELIGGDDGLLGAVTASLQGAGLVPTSGSTLKRALGRGEATVIDLRDDPRGGTVAGLIVEQLRDEAGALIEQDWALRAGRPGAVHEMRVAIRHLRCDLATWRPFLDQARVDPVRQELRWLGGLLGRLRDAEMLESRLVGTVRGLPADMVVGPVLDRIERELRSRRQAGADRVASALDGTRYFGLLDALETLAADPPLTARASAPAEDELSRRVSHAIGRLDRALVAVEAPSSPEARAERLHEVRKAAKRAGYAAESLEPKFGRRAQRLAERMLQLQDVLGEHHDSVVTMGALREIGSAAHLAGENAFTYGVLHGIERDRGEEAERAFDALRRTMGPSSKAHRWTSV